jgi:multiple sugar transport system permease protein
MLDTTRMPIPEQRTLRLRRQRRARDWFPYALIAPAALFMLLVHVVPTAAGIYTSFLRLNLFTFSELFRAPWVGLENFRSILFDAENPVRPGLWNAARNTFFYTAYTLTLTLVLAMCLALLLNREFRGRRVLRTLMLAPWVVPSFVVAVLWQFMWQSESGIVNKVLVDYTHVLDERPVWLLGPHSLWAIVIPSVWRGLPFVALVFLAGLQAIPKDLHEAAAIDGANGWQRFRYITLPLLRPLIAIQVLFGFIYCTYQFALPYVMLGTNPGPYADLMMTLVVRQSFGNTLFGYGAAISTLLMIVMFLCVLIWYAAFKRDLVAAR